MAELLTAGQVVEMAIERLRDGESVSVQAPDHRSALGFASRVSDAFVSWELQEQKARWLKLTNRATFLASTLRLELRGCRGVTFLYEATKGGWARLQFSPLPHRLTRFERTFFDDR